jgi:superfamily II DNA or RNA helicase
MSGVVWVHKSKIDYATVVGQLRVEGKGYDGPKYHDCWYIEDDMVGLPRYWAAKSGYVGNYSQVPTEWGDFKGQYRWDQEKKINQICSSLEKEQCTLFSAGTGWGKTVAGCAVAAKLGMRTLVIADMESLLDQWEASAKTFFGVDSCRIQGKLWEDTDCPLTTATIQTLAISQNKDRLLGKFGLTIFDEAHTFSTPSFHKVMPYLDSQYRLGVSATFRRSDGLTDVWHHHLGKVTVEAKRERMAATYVAPAVEFTIPPKEYTTKGELNHAKMLTAISQLAEYNEWLADVITQCREKGRRVLFLSHRTEQCKILNQLLTAKGIESRIYVGSTKPADLEEARRVGIILSTYGKFAKGVDASELDTLVLGTPCSDIEQPAGRIMRVHPDKQTPLIVDVDHQHPYLRALFNKRVAHYNNLGITKST